MFGHDYSPREEEALRKIREDEMFGSISPAGIHGKDWPASSEVEPQRKKGKCTRAIEISTGTQYIIYDSTEDELCIIQTFDYAEYPFKRQLLIWQPKNRFLIK